ncbi:hypothetical protein ACJMK2_006054 [Sinanodonta woodiana]|uniref:Nucleoplasmin core domain-containing protein n=1 Tax=Sinanodonta woodiana TaxID=1069815 RepID=A0ABD3VRY7_SINWO
MFRWVSDECRIADFMFSCELRKDKLDTTWSFEEEEEEEDTEYLIHTLFLKHAMLGSTATKGERNVVEIETKNFEKNIVKQPLICLSLGQQEMFNLDISFSQGSPVTFRLIEGSGPVYLAGQQLVEYPDDINESQDESMLDDDLGEEAEISKDEESFKKIPAKRKASSQISGKVKVIDQSSDRKKPQRGRGKEFAFNISMEGAPSGRVV